jgi:IS30 family transposase
VKTLTFDNGKEFAQHQKTGELLNAKTYLQDIIPPKTKER